MATIVAAAGGGNWSSTATWVGGAVPTAADDVQLSATSGNVTIDAAAACRSLDCSGGGASNYTGTLTHNAAITLSVGTSTPGTSNIALKFVSGMTYTLGNAATSAISFVSTSTTQQSVTWASKAPGNIVFNGAGGKWQMQDGFTSAANASVTLNAGTLDLNGQTFSFGAMISNFSTARTLTLGASNITATGQFSGWNLGTTTNLSFNAGTSTITFTGNSSQMYPGPLTYNNVVFAGVGNPFIGNNSAATFANLTRTGTAVKTDSFGTSANITVTGTLTLSGNSVTNRMLVQAYVANTATNGTRVTITCNGSVVATNCDFQDINGAGTASWNLSSATGGSGDCGNNANITFTTPATQTRSGSGGNWSTAANWTSRVPLPQDDVTINSNASGTVTGDMPRIGKSINFTGFTGTYSITANPTIYGSLVFDPGMTVSNASMVLSGRGNYTITTNSKVFTGAITVNCGAGVYTLQDDLTVNNNFVVTSGGFDTNSKAVTSTTLVFNGNVVRSLNMRSSVWNLTTPSTATIFNCSGTNYTLNASNSTIIIGQAPAAIRTFAGGGNTFGTLSYPAGLPGELDITGANTFTNLNIAGGRILSLPAGVTTTVSNFTSTGQNNGYIYLPGIAANYASVPHASPLSITGDIDIRARVALNSWFPSSSANSILGKWNSGGNQRSFVFQIAVTTGRLRFVFSQTGATSLGYESTVAPNFAAGSAQWVRVTRVASTGVVTFYTGTDINNWTQLGTTVSSTAGSMAANTISVEMGSTDGGASNFLAGALYRVQLRNNALDNGTGIVLDADFSSKPLGQNTFTESSSNAATVNIFGSMAQASDGRLVIVSSAAGNAATLSKTSGIVATADYLTLQDSAAAGGANWFAGPHSSAVSNVTGWIFGTSPTPSASFMPFFN